MNKLAAVIIAGMFALTLTACQTSPTGEQIGAVTGGVLGGVLGSNVGGGTGRTAATIGGTLIGGMLGGAIGRSMDQSDRYRTAQTFENNRTQQTSTWTNPDTNNQYAVTPTDIFQGSDGRPCRNYESTIYVDGSRETATGTACRNSDGSWQIVS